MGRTEKIDETIDEIVSVLRIKYCDLNSECDEKNTNSFERGEELTKALLDKMRSLRDERFTAIDAGGCRQYNRISERLEAVAKEVIRLVILRDFLKK